MKPTRSQLRELRRNNLKYPDALIEVPRSAWPDMSQYPGPASGSVVIGLWRSRAFVVTHWLEPNGFNRLSVQRTEWDERRGRWRDDISWDDLQRLKAEAGYGDQCAVETYPPDSHLINVANMRHLFLLPAEPPFMWRRGG